MLQMESSESIWRGHLGREGMSDVGIIGVCHLGSYRISTSGQFHAASSLEYVASLRKGNLADISFGVFHKAYLNCMVVVGSAYKSYAVASE